MTPFLRTTLCADRCGGTGPALPRAVRRIHAQHAFLCAVPQERARHASTPLTESMA